MLELDSEEIIIDSSTDISENYESTPHPITPQRTHVDVLEKWMKMYHDIGWYSIPCFIEVNSKHYGDSKKHPDFGRTPDGKMRKWQTFVPQLEHMLEDLRTFKSFRLGVPPNALAILTGKHSNLLVLDCDDDAVCMKFLDRLGIQIYAAAYSVETQSGKGSQIYFKWDDRLDKIKTTLSKFFGKDVPIDIRGEGGLVFAPPSKVRDFDTDTVRHYKLPILENGHKMKIYSPPENLIKFLIGRVKEREAKVSVNAGSCIKKTTELSDKQKAVFTKSVHELETAVVGTRSEKCFSVICTFIKFQIHPDDAFEMVKSVSKFKERDRAFFDEMWNNALGHVGDDGYVKGAPPVTALQKAANIIFQPTAADFLAYKPDRTVPELLGFPFYRRKSLSMVCGDAGVGKTTLALDLVKAASRGLKCWDDQISFETPLKVLIFHGDLNAAVFEHQYLTKMSISYDDPQIVVQVLSSMNDLLHNATRVDEATGAEVASFDLLDAKNYRLYRDFMTLVKPDIVLIDTLTSFLSSDQNDPGAMKKVLQFLKFTASEFNHHCMVLHHARKRGSDNVAVRDMMLDDVRGSSAIAALCDFILAQSNVADDEGKKMKGCGHVHPIKEGSEGAAFNMFEDFRYRIVNESENSVSINYGYNGVEPERKKERGENESLINTLAYLQKERDASECVNKICSEYDCKVRAAEMKLAKFVSEGVLTKTRAGRKQLYTITHKGLDLLPVTTESMKEFIATPSIKDIITTRAMEEEMSNKPTNITDDQRKSWYGDRINYDDPKDFPVEVPEWDTVKHLYSDNVSVPYALDIAELLWYRCDKFGNMWYNDMIAILKKDRENYNFDLAHIVLKSMLDFEQVWYHAHYEEIDGVQKLKNIVLHPTRELFMKFLNK
jgi:archaellum biogenesis ATPase FlaH/predicted transcriptional regulator